MQWSQARQRPGLYALRVNDDIRGLVEIFVMSGDKWGSSTPLYRVHWCTSHFEAVQSLSDYIGVADRKYFAEVMTRMKSAGALLDDADKHDLRSRYVDGDSADCAGV